MCSESGSRVVIIMVLIAFCFSVIPAPAIHASMLGTGVVLENDSQNIRDRLNNMLEAEDVRRALEDRGVSVAEAQARVDALSEAQLRQVAGQVDALPSGQGLATIGGVVLIIFVVLLITDIAGLTNVFPFVISQR